MTIEPIHLALAVGGGIALILLLGWIVAHNAAKVVQQPDPWMDGNQ